MKNNYRYQISKKNNYYIVSDSLTGADLGIFETYEKAKTFALVKTTGNRHQSHKHSNLMIKISDGFHINYDNRYNYI